LAVHYSVSIKVPTLVTGLMKNQFCDTLNCGPLEVVCFKPIKSCFSTEKCYAVYSVVVPVLTHEVKARWAYFTLVEHNYLAVMW